MTSRRGAWVVLVLGLLVVTALIGALRGSEAPARADRAPSTSESARAAAVLATAPDHDIQPVLLVATRADGGSLTTADTAALAGLGATLPTLAGHPASPAVGSGDGKAALVQVPIRVSPANSDTAKTVTDLRTRVAAATPAGLDVLVTGGPAFGADIAKAFDGADVTLLLVTIGIVALLLLLTYRSPVLWLIPLAVVGLADQLAAVVTATLGQAYGLQFDAGIVSVLVFGAGTNYALLLTSRYREELHHTADHRIALAAALRGTAPAIVASNLTVVLALGSLVLASIPGTRGLGIASGAGLLVALVVVLTLLPSALAVCGRRIFWPFVPKPGATVDPARTPFGRVAGSVIRRPVVVLAAGITVLGILATGLLGTRLGLDQTERFRSASESAAGLTVLSQHFPAGMAQPVLVVTDAAHVDAVARAGATVEGVKPAGTKGAVVTFVTDAAPGSADARERITSIRTAVHAVPGANALVGGDEATDLDARIGNEHDLRIIVPVVLGISGIVLLVLLRSIVAPLLLLPLNALSALAAIGAGSWLGRHLLDWPGLDLQVPLIAFLFLVALGIDYTIFLVHRARVESVEHGTRAGMVRAVGATGVVITSAGVVLAAVFAALGVLPLVTLGQLGLIVGLGVLLDTVVVRTVLVPALAGLVGERLWWPRRAR